MDPTETIEIFLEKHVLSVNNVLLMVFTGFTFMGLIYKNYKWYYKI